MSEDGDGNSADKHSIMRFYEDGQEELFKVLSLWISDETMSSSSREKVFVFPEGRSPMKDAEAHIFPSLSTLPELKEPYFHMATLLQSDGCTSVLYSFIYQTKDEITLRLTDDLGGRQIPSNTVITLVIESRFLHPTVFFTVLTHAFNSFLHVGGNDDIESNLMMYWKPILEHEEGKILFTWSPFDISMDTEIGKLQHYMFTLLKPDTICRLIERLLLGPHIFITALSTTKLCMGCFGALALIYPVQWPLNFISTVAEEWLDMALSPVPLLIGIPFVFMSKPQLESADAFTLVNLDFGSLENVSRQGPIEEMDLRAAAVRDLTARLLSDELKGLRQAEGFPAYRIRMIIWKYIMALLLIAFDFDGHPDWTQLTHDDVIGVIERWKDRRDRDGKEFSEWQTNMQESQVIDYFATNYQEIKLKLPEDWHTIFRGMSDFQNEMKKRTK